MKMTKFLYAALLCAVCAMQNGFAYKFKVDNQTTSKFHVTFDLAVCKDSDYKNRTLNPGENHTWTIENQKGKVCIPYPKTSCHKKCGKNFLGFYSCWDVCKTKMKKSCKSTSISRAGCCLSKFKIEAIDGPLKGKTANAAGGCVDKIFKIYEKNGQLKIASKDNLFFTGWLDSKQDSGRGLISGGKALKGAPGELEAGLIPVKNMPAKFDAATKQIDDAILKIQSAKIDIQKQKVDIKAQQPEMAKAGLGELGGTIIEALDQLDTALVKLGDKITGILPKFVTAAQSSKEEANNVITNLNGQIKTMREKVFNKRSGCIGGTLPERMNYTGSVLANQKYKPYK